MPCWLSKSTWDRANYESMLNEAVKLRYQCRPNKIYCDGANPELISSLKVRLNENPDYKSVIEQANRERINYEYRMFVVPVSFNEYGKMLLGRFQHVVSKHWFSISNIEHKELVTQMRMAEFKDNGNLDKTETGNNTFDVFDSTRLALMLFEMGGAK